MLDRYVADTVGSSQCNHSIAQGECVELADGEGAVAASRAAGVACEPNAGAAGGIGESCVHDLHEFGVAGEQGRVRKAYAN